MIEIGFLRANTELAKERLAKRNKYPASVIDDILKLDDERKRMQTELDNTLAETNATSKEIGKLMGQGQRDAAEAMKAKVASLKAKKHRARAGTQSHCRRD